MHTQNVEAIVLKVYDVGEADRFCILFTKEKGRLAARARGVRKLTSRMGAALLPFGHVRVELKKLGNDGWLVAGAERMFTGLWFMVDGSKTTNQRTINQQTFLRAFSQAVEGTELLLKLLHDGEPLPEIFEATLHFFSICHENHPHAVLCFTFQLLHLLGHLPATDETFFEQCSTEERNFIARAREGNYAEAPTFSSDRTLRAIADALIGDQISSPLRAERVMLI
jgi:DNA repair protein RecO (recombination protein O)